MTYHCAPLMRRSLILVGCEGAKARIQVSRRELHTHIHLNQARIEFLYCKKKKKKKERSLDLKLHFNLENYLFFHGKCIIIFIKLFTIGPLMGIEKPLGFWKNESLFLRNNEGQLLLYDPSAQKILIFKLMDN